MWALNLWPESSQWLLPTMKTKLSAPVGSAEIPVGPQVAEGSTASVLAKGAGCEEVAAQGSSGL